ncbi:hypothetical protein DL768_010387 [Monosporascus sp. mg162]|nr:hypothetical protein DL768_010387 [Monosporascus sp. mg162]
MSILYTLSVCLDILLRFLNIGKSQCLTREDLNKTLGGRLVKAAPLATPCFSNPNGEACASLKTELTSWYYRTSKYEGFRHLQGEACAADTDDQCLLETSTLSPPPNSQCGQGVVSPEYVKITGEGDVRAIFDYAKSSGSLLSIKNTGIDFNGRSSRQGSLAIWTRGLQDMVYNPSFSPNGCADGGATSKAITIGAGVRMDEAVLFAHENGVVFSGGNDGSAGVAGGWSLNGGHGFLSGSLGLGADRVVEITIVTPDGEVRVVNSCVDSDLFWALRGGGGGTFGVVLNSTHLVEDEAPLTVAVLSFPATAENERPFVSLLAENLPSWALEGWGGPSFTNLSVLVNPFLDVAEAETMLEPIVSYVKDQGGNSEISLYPTYFDFYKNAINGTFAHAQPISTAVTASTRLIPESMFQDTTARESVVDAIMEAQASGYSPCMMTDTPYRYGRDNQNPGTSLPSVWYKSVTMLSATVEWPGSSSLEDRKQAVSSFRGLTDSWAALSPEGAAYSNEADPWTEDWAQQYWGENYDRLLEVKQRFDPDGLLSCWHCVGWEESQPAYECLSGLAP